MDEQFVNAVLQSTDGILYLSTPPSPAEKYIRSSLLPNLCKDVVKNERYYSEFAIFETAQVFRDENYTSPYDEREKLPSQRKNVAGAFAAAGKDITALFRKAKGVIEMMPRYTHMEGFTFKQVEKPVWADNVVWLNIYLGDEKVGDLALLAKKALLRPLDTPHPDPFYAALEKELLDLVNATGVGPQGFGGRTTALGLAIETLPTHVASLPVAVNINCHVTRRASVEL